MHKRCLQLFLSIFRLSACTFGGGFVIIPLLRKRFVEQLGWIDEQEMLDLIAIAQSSPGAIAVNASILIGYRVAGIAGVLTATAAATLPPLIILSIVSMFYQAFRSNAVVNIVMAGMTAGVAAVVCDVAVSMAKSVLSNRRLLNGIMLVGCFVAIRFFDVNIIAVLALCGAVGAADTWRRTRRKSA